MKRIAVRTAWTEAEAQIVVWRLREADIDASMEGGTLAAAAFDIALTERGGIKVVVPEDQVEQANAELRRMASGESGTDEASTDDDESEASVEIEDDADPDEVAAEEAAFQAQRLRAKRLKFVSAGLFVRRLWLKLCVAVVIVVTTALYAIFR